MENKYIVIKGARENNLKNIDLEIPKYSLTVFTGLSGSGKTTLAFDTIFAEGQRRFVESLSSYARQFLGGMEKPDVDNIEGLSPAISIDQKTTSHNPRSTVGTVTEIYDYLRLLFARVGVPYCPEHNIPIVSFSVTKMTDIALQYEEGTKLQILSPVVKNEKGTHKDLLAKILSSGFERVRVDGEIKRIPEVEELEKNKRHNIEIVVDRVIVRKDQRSRIAEAIELACDWSKGYCVFFTEKEERLFSQHHSCPVCGFSVPKLEPRLFSFNAPLGCCPDCKGVGIKRECNMDYMIPNKSLSINQGGIRWYKNTIGTKNIEWQEFAFLCKQYNIDLDKPLGEFTEKEMNIITYGSDREFKYELTSVNGNVMHRNGYIEGVKTKLDRLYNETNSPMMREFYELFMKDTECSTCHGARLSKQALAVKVHGLNIYEVTCLSVEDLLKWINELPSVLNKTEFEIAKMIINEIKNRVSFLCNVGLNYLTLSRNAGTLSGGEAQRIRLATQIGSRLSGVLYVLDEPSIGLHQRDNEKLINSLLEMRDLGNTLVVVEHDTDTMLASDYLVDIGPGAGDKGGYVVAAGTPEEVMKNKDSITGQYLSGKLCIETPKTRRKGLKKYLKIKGAKENNLKNIDVDIPLGTFTCVTGVSGSGKSSLVNEILVKALSKKIYNSKEHPGKHDKLLGADNIDKIVAISQNPIGRTPRSNPATYTGVFDDIRELFTTTKEAKMHGFEKNRFSFNVKGGRCEACRGDGVKKIEMHFLPDVYVPCEVCHGTRYNTDTLNIKYKGKNIAEVLDMRVSEALEFFENVPKIKRKLEVIDEVGLGYIKLGQSAPTLSGGEAERVKLAKELQKISTGKTLYVLDEPTTGLHTDDIKRLLAILQKMVDNKNTVLVIEHNLDVIKTADYIIDLGPDGGDQGGTVVATGTPEDIAKVKESYTGEFLKKIL